MSAGSTRDRITCPHCQGSLKAPPLPAGSLCTCPKCGQSFPIGQSTPAGKTAAAAAPAAMPAAAPATPKPKPPASKVPAAKALAEAPVRAELAKPKLAPAPVQPTVQTPVVTADAGDEIGQMLLGNPAPPAAHPAGPAATRPKEAIAGAPNPSSVRPAPPSPPAPSSGSPRTDSGPQQERQLSDLLNAPAKAAASAARRSEPRPASTMVQPAHQQQAPSPDSPSSATSIAPALVAKVLAPEIPVVCKLCGTRMYAKPEQVGSRIRCPDCHTENDVANPQVPVARPRAAVTDADDDFVLSDPGQRPGYRPLVEPRGDYAALKYLDTSATPRRPDAPSQPRHVSTEVTMTISQTATEEDDGPEVTLSAPVERIDVKEIVKLPEPDDPDEDNQFRGRFRDDEWGFMADPRQKDAWKKSPFYYGILGFPFYPETALRVVLYSFLLTIDLALFLAAVFCSRGETPLLFAALGLTVASSIVSVFTLGGSLPCLVAVTQDTANGHDAVASWPDWNIAEWLFTAMMIPVAALLAALPGSLLSGGFFALGSVGFVLSPYPILVSELVFFPIIFGSMMAEGSFLPMSGDILKSLPRRGEGWLLFYCLSILLGVPLAGSMALVELGVQLRTVLVAPFAAVLWVVAIVYYFRLLGRLLWYVQNYRRERDPVD